MSFKDFLLREELRKAISSCGFEHPFEVQQQCLPHSLLGLDLLCQAKAGMGKTAVFVLTALNRLPEFGETNEVSCLVLVHTRELAFQIAKEFDRFSQNLNYKTLVIIGGENMQDQMDKLKNDKPQIVVATPGRLLSFIRKGVIDTKNVKIFIVDECDKMLKELGKEVYNIARYEIRRPADLQVHPCQEAGDDVLGHSAEGNQRSLQEVHVQALRGFG